MDSWAGFKSHVTHLECSATGERYAAGQPHNLSKAGKPLLVRYDLPAIARVVRRDDLRDRTPDFWRYREFLPVPRAADVVSLGEEMTPLVSLNTTSAQFGGGELLVKDEGRLPTASFKARGMAVAVSMAKSFGTKQMALPTVGSGGASFVAYCRRAGIDPYVFCPEDSPALTMGEIAFYGDKFFAVKGALEDCNRLVGEGCERMGWFNISTLKEPYRIEGKKTMGLELAEQLGWELPDVIFYPTGGGTGFIGMWKAFDELEAVGWIGSKRPRMVAVQTTGCCPIVKAAEQGHKEVQTPWPEIRTKVHGVRVAKPLGDFLILRVVYESKGFGSAVSDEDVERTRAAIAVDDGVMLSPEGAACVAAYRDAVTSGKVKKSERAVVFNTATGLRSPMGPIKHHIDPSRPVDYAKL
ncbi:MAG: threonine synthase [Variibacter sp.]